MKLETLLLMANPRDEEEEDMALLCCYATTGELFLMTRFPEDDEIEITLGEDDPVLVRDIKVTVEPGLLKVEATGGLFHGSDLLEIEHDTDAADMPDVLETLENVLQDTGTLVKAL